MVDSLLKVLEAGLSIWLSKEKTKYQDDYISLKKQYYEEYKKDLSERSDAVLDSISMDIRILCDSFSAAVGKQNLETKS